MHQLILTFPASDFADWQADFAAGTEALAEAGLSVLQVWRDADAPRALVLLEHRDRTRAEAWLAQHRGLSGPVEATFLETA
jgi:hypothetical protein